MNFIAVYVGKFEKVPDSKKTATKLNSLGYRAYVFSLGDFYSLRIGAYTDASIAQKLCDKLKSIGFEAFIQ